VSSDRTLSMRPSSVAPRGNLNDLTPIVHRVVERIGETNDITTLVLEPLDAPSMTFRCGQFNMLSAFGVGEIAISMSSAPVRARCATASETSAPYPTRSARAVSATSSVCAARSAATGSWSPPASRPTSTPVTPLWSRRNRTRPLRGAVEELVRANERGGGRVFVLVGAREPSQIVFRADLDSWRARGAKVSLTVDLATPEWDGRVGLVTTLLADAVLTLPIRGRCSAGPKS